MEQQKPSRRVSLKTVAIVFGCAFVAVCVWRVATYKPPASQRTLNQWAKQVYAPITPTEDFKQKLSSISITSEAPLTPGQTGAIRQAVFDMVVAFHGDTYDEYRKFRTPVPPKGFNLAQIEVQRQYCKKNWKNPSGEVPDDPEGIFKRFWEVVFLNKYVDPKTVKNSTIGKPFWNAVCLAKSQVVVEEFRTMPGSFLKYLNTQENAGAMSCASSFVFPNTPEDILEKSGKLTCATVQLLVEYPTPEAANPAYCRYYWDEASNTWLPMNFGMVVSGMLRTREPVF